MTNIEILAAVTKWQRQPSKEGLFFCRIDKRHTPLVPEEHAGHVVLVCPDCGNLQEWIPPEVFHPTERPR